MLAVTFQVFVFVLFLGLLLGLSVWPDCCRFQFDSLFVVAAVVSGWGGGGRRSDC